MALIMELHGPQASLKGSRASIRARLARAHGHLHGVIDMIDEERSDEDILHQLNAVRAALTKATGILLDDLMARAQQASAQERGEAIGRLRAAVHTLA
jgi:DNA-binding FrmR family transcriptional regulator